jgi:hypothetical protein
MVACENRVSLERILFYCCCILSASPLLFSHYPPMVDLPQHAAQVATLRQLDSPDFAFGHLFLVHWWVPYRGGYSLLWLLSQWMPIVLAVKVLLSAVIVAIPLTASRLRAFFGGDPSWDWLMLPIAYGLAFQWGFLNFFVAVPFVLAFLLCFFKYVAKPSPLAALGVALFALLLLYMHVLAAAFACGLALLYGLFDKAGSRQKLLLTMPLFSPLLPTLLWFLGALGTSEQARDSVNWALGWYRPLEVLASSVGLPMDYTLGSYNSAGDKAFGPAAWIFSLLVVALPFFQGARLTKDRRLLALFVAYVIWMMFGPDRILGNSFTYQRFAIFGLPLFLLILVPSTSEKKPAARWSSILVYLLPVVLIASNCVRFSRFDDESQAYRTIASNMAPGKRVLMLVFETIGASVKSPVYVHFPAWYQAESGGLIDYSFAQNHSLLYYREGAASPIGRGFEWSPASFDWQRHQGWLFDYFVVRSSLQPSISALASDAGCRVVLIARAEKWWLYERLPQNTGTPDTCVQGGVGDPDIEASC